MHPPPRAGVVLGTWPTGLPDRGADVLALARQVEDCGLDLLFTGDHLFGHTPSGDALATLAAFAACTERVLLGTAVLLLALREPAVVAKQVATVDYLSGGRTVLGIGVGGEVEQEWAAMEVPLAERGSRTDEHLDLLRRLWRDEAADWRGTYRTVRGVTGSPRPAQPGGPPVWIGGRSEAALRRAARHEGWCAYAMSAGGLARRLERLEAEFRGDRPADFRVSHVLFATADPSVERARATAGAVLAARYRAPFDDYLDSLCALGPPAAVGERVAAYLDAGAQDILFAVQSPTSELPRQIESLAEAWHGLGR